jgi:uncharacterized protein (TIGR00369 family)
MSHAHAPGTTEKLSQSKGYGVPLPFIDLLGVERINNDEGRALIALTIRPELRNSWKVAHGGVIMTMLDSVMGLAARLHLNNSGASMTVDMSVKFISAGTGNRLIAEGKVIGGKTTLFCEAEVRDENSALVAKGLGTLRQVRNP